MLGAHWLKISFLGMMHLLKPFMKNILIKIINIKSFNQHIINGANMNRIRVWKAFLIDSNFKN